MDPLSVQCSACLAEPGQPCYATSTDEPRRVPHRLRVLAASRQLVRCDQCEGLGWIASNK